MNSQYLSGFITKFLSTMARLVGNSLLYGSIFTLITGSIVYATTGTKILPNFLSSGVDFISFFSGAADGNIGIDAKSFYARTNGSWIGYPADNRNYLRNDTFMSGALYDENNSAYYVNPNGTSQFNTMSGKTICLNGDCKTSWPATSTGGIVTGVLRWSSEYGNTTYTGAWNTCLSLSPINSWRLPSSEDMEYGKQINSGLFTGDKMYRTTTPYNYNEVQEYFLSWNPFRKDWYACRALAGDNIICYDYFGGSIPGSPYAFRCVSNL